MPTVNLTDFDPRVDTFWICFMDGRTRAALKRGPCMTVFSNWSKGSLWRVENGRFELIAAKNPDTHDGRCERCGLDIRAVGLANQTHHYYNGSGYMWLRNGSKVAEPLQLVRWCVDCIYGS